MNAATAISFVSSPKQREKIMTEIKSYAEDCAERLADGLREGRLSRRQFVNGLALLGIAGAGSTLSGRVMAAGQVKEVVLSNWGGDAVEAFRKAFAVPFEQSTGIKMAIDGSGPLAGKIKAMVEAKHVTWDVCDSGAGTSVQLGEQGLLEPIDYNVVSRDKLLPEFQWKYGVANYVFSTVLTYDKRRFDTEPKTWADFWDLKRFPGKRLLRKDIQGVMEAALMADGVPIDKLYPLDTKRALAKIAEIKEHCLYWGSGADSQRFMRDGEASMGLLWHTRAILAEQDSKGNIGWTFNQGLLTPGAWVVPKGAPAGEWAMKAIASMQDPEQQVKMLELMGNGPPNPAAAKMVPEKLQRLNPMAPENIKVQGIYNTDWYGKHQEQALQAYLDVISS
jgi:putative spermidine/putrescine transport system substrate-binding protein